MVKFKHFLIILIFCLMTTLYAQEEDSSAAAEQKSGLSFNLMKYDFGVVEVDSIVTHIYSFKNASRETIKINKVTSS